jgi:hypothetical protein
MADIDVTLQTQPIIEVTVDSNETVIEVQLTNGVRGKSAYQSAVDGGFTGSEAAFNTTLARINTTIVAMSIALG